MPSEADYFEPETRWIEDEARVIAKRQGKNFCLLEVIGLTAHRLGDTDTEIRSQMKFGKLRRKWSKKYE